MFAGLTIHSFLYITFGKWYNRIKRKSMRIAVLICCTLALALLVSTGLSYTPGISFGVSVTDIDNGVIIQNVGNVACLVFVSSPEGVQQFQLAVGENVTVTGVAQPVDVSLTDDLTTSWADWERMNRIHEEMVKSKYDLSSNFTDP
jgi:hypothetical protein